MKRALVIPALLVGFLVFLTGGKASAGEREGEELKKDILRAVEKMMDRKLDDFRDGMLKDIKELLARRGSPESRKGFQPGPQGRFPEGFETMRPPAPSEEVLRVVPGGRRGQTKVMVLQEKGRPKARIRIERDGKVIEKDIEIDEEEEEEGEENEDDEEGEGWEGAPPWLEAMKEHLPEGFRDALKKAKAFAPEGFREGMRWVKEFAPEGFEFGGPGKGGGRGWMGGPRNGQKGWGRMFEREEGREGDREGRGEGQPGGGREWMLPRGGNERGRGAEREPGARPMDRGPGDVLRQLQMEKDALQGEIEQLRQMVRKLAEKREKGRR